MVTGDYAIQVAALEQTLQENVIVPIASSWKPAGTTTLSAAGGTVSGAGIRLSVPANTFTSEQIIKGP